MAGHFHYYLRVRYGECDAQKVVYNARYGDYIDLAATEFLRALGYGEALVNGQLDYQLVKQTLEWKASARFDEVLEISVHASRLGNTSFTLAMEFRIAGRDPAIATAETIYVFVNAKTLEKMALPAHFRAALERGAGGAFVDHADYVSSSATKAT